MSNFPQADFWPGMTIELGHEHQGVGNGGSSGFALMYAGDFASRVLELYAFFESLQLGVFGFGLLEGGIIRVGVFPEREKILIGGARLRAVSR
jgi:hypothetical protein